ncbi:hypothetical protein E2542_SST28517 [Spatholobus suberectus]|nr:hypothetical protein E2542_SST28517 [Spatholobus suberectus]
MALTLGPTSAYNVSFPNQTLYSGFYHNHCLKPIITNCHGKLNSSSGGESYVMDEVGFDEDDVESSVNLLINIAPRRHLTLFCPD